MDDPYVDAPLNRAPLTDHVDVIVVGGGFGGLLTGARLTEAGMGKVRIIEKGGDFGGMVLEPLPRRGLRCGILCLPALVRELNFVPKEKYTHAPEILAYSRAIGEKFNL